MRCSKRECAFREHQVIARTLCSVVQKYWLKKKYFKTFHSCHSFSGGRKCTFFELMLLMTTNTKQNVHPNGNKIMINHSHQTTVHPISNFEWSSEELQMPTEPKPFDECWLLQINCSLMIDSHLLWINPAYNFFFNIQPCQINLFATSKFGLSSFAEPRCTGVLCSAFFLALVDVLRIAVPWGGYRTVWCPWRVCRHGGQEFTLCALRPR